MSDQGYTPTTEEVQRGYRRPPSARDGQLPGELFSDFLSRVSIRTALQEVADRVAFDRWLTEVRREAAVKVLREAHADLVAYTDSGAPFGGGRLEDFLLRRADRIEKDDE